MISSLPTFHFNNIKKWNGSQLDIENSSPRTIISREQFVIETVKSDCQLEKFMNESTDVFLEFRGLHRNVSVQDAIVQRHQEKV